MSAKKPKSLNSQLFTFICNRLKLKRREKTIFYRLLGFLIRNNKSFPYSIKSLSELTGYSESSVYESLNTLESLRLIKREGYTSRVKFNRGTILSKSLALVQNRTKRNLIKTRTLVQNLEKIAPASPVSGYNKTSSFLKHKEKGSLTTEELQEISWYLKNPQFPVKKEHAYLFES